MLPSQRFLIVRLIRKLAKWIGYKVDFAPLSISDVPNAKMRYLKSLCERASVLPGDIVECGLGNGVSFGHLAEVGHKHTKQVYGYDSLKGFPKPSVEDRSSYEVHEGDWSSVELRNIEQHVLAHVPDEYYRTHVHIIPGFFSDTLADVPFTQIAFLHLDADLYQSYVDCLDALYAKVVTGGIIAFDEYLNGIEYAKYPGGFRALTAYFADKQVDICRDVKTGKYYVVKA